jgi:hypothetical protein
MISVAFVAQRGTSIARGGCNFSQVFCLAEYFVVVRPVDFPRPPCVVYLLFLRSFPDADCLFYSTDEIASPLSLLVSITDHFDNLHCYYGISSDNSDNSSLHGCASVGSSSVSAKISAIIARNFFHFSSS